MVRGWNSALGLLLPHVNASKGVPLIESTNETRAAAMTMLCQLGRSTVLRESAEMIRNGMAEGLISEHRIVLKMSQREFLGSLS